MSDQPARSSRAVGPQLADPDTVFLPAPGERVPRDEGSGPAAPKGAAPSLYVRRGAKAGQRLMLALGSTVLGRHGECDVVLPDATVSRRHTEIRRGDVDVVLSDLGSLNGSYVNGQPVETAVLTDGDDISVGVFRFTFHTAR